MVKKKSIVRDLRRKIDERRDFVEEGAGVMERRENWNWGFERWEN